MLESFLKDKIEDLNKNGIRLKIIGNIKKFPKKIQIKLRAAQKFTEKNKKLQLILALNYGSKSEIVNATHTDYILSRNNHFGFMTGQRTGAPSQRLGGGYKIVFSGTPKGGGNPTGWPAFQQFMEPNLPTVPKSNRNPWFLDDTVTKYNLLFTSLFSHMILKDKDKSNEIIKLAIKRMIPSGPLGRKQISNCKIYRDSNHMHEAQNPKILDISSLNRKNTI